MPNSPYQCELAKKHPKETLGFLLYKVRPEEFAYGFCLGKEACGKDLSSAASAAQMGGFPFDTAAELPLGDIVPELFSSSSEETFKVAPYLIRSTIPIF